MDRTTPIALVGASVLSMTSDSLLTDHTVLVRDGRIEGLGPTPSVLIPIDARVIDLRGRYVMPGLVDMHVHNVRRDAAKFVPAGVTTVRSMWGYPGLLEFTRSVDALPIDAPTILAVSPGIDGRPPTWPYTRLLDDALKVRDSLEIIASEGWLALKIYDRVPAQAFDSIVAIAREKGVAVVGHVPWSVSITRALASGMHEIEHLSGYDLAVGGRSGVGLRNWASADPSRFQALAAATAESGTWNCATLVVVSRLLRRYAPQEREDGVRRRRAFVKALFDAGARLLIGTDSGTNGNAGDGKDIVPAGSSIVDELEEHVRAGIPRFHVLRAATVNSAESVGQTLEFGAIIPGARADLLVLDANPLEGTRTLRSPRAVVLRGSWIGYR